MGALFKAQSFVSSVLSLVCILAALALVVQNLATVDDLQIWAWKVHTSVSVLALGTGVLMAIGMLLKMGGILAEVNHKGKKAGRAAERGEVSLEEAQAKTKVLESKVETLEKALQEAIKQIPAISGSAVQ